MDELLDVAVERPVLDQLEVEVGSTLETGSSPVWPEMTGKSVTCTWSTSPAAISDRFGDPGRSGQRLLRAFAIGCELWCLLRSGAEEGEGSPGGSGDLVGVDPAGWGEDREPSSAEVHAPAVVVDDPVMLGAEQHQVVQGGRAALGPVPDVVGVAPAGWAAAAGERAAAVAHDQRPPQRGRDDPGAAADVEQRAGGVDDRGDSARRRSPAGGWSPVRAGCRPPGTPRPPAAAAPASPSRGPRRSASSPARLVAGRSGVGCGAVGRSVSVWRWPGVVTTVMVTASPPQVGICSEASPQAIELHQRVGAPLLRRAAGRVRRPGRGAGRPAPAGRRRGWRRARG